MKLLPLAKRRPSPAPAAMALPQLFARQSTDCSSGAFYRCSLNNFAGCCSVDPCAMEDGCPDDEDEDEEDEDEPDENEPDEDEKEEPSSTEREETRRTTQEEKTTTVARTRTATATVTMTNDDGDVTQEVVTSVVTNVQGAPLPTDLADTDDNNPDSDSDDSGGGLSAGAIAGIAVGIAALLLLIAALLFYRRRRRRRARESTHEAYPAHTPTDEKFLSAATTPAGFSGKLGSRAPTPSTPGRSDGNGRYSYVSSLTASPPPGSVAFPRGVGEPHPGVAQLDSEPVATIAEMDGAAARPSELPASPLGAAAPPGRGLGLGSARQPQGQGQGQGQGSQLPTVAEVEPGLRATLNPTEGERSQQTYVTSWSEFGGKQVGGNTGT